MLVTFAIAAICLSPPVNGPVVAGYSPSGLYAGHWGVDYAASPGEPVLAPVTGVVTFAGSVAGMRSVTIQPVAGYKISVSYLASVAVVTGETVARGRPVGIAGLAHGREAVHLSVRIDDRYVDPSGHMGCARADISRAVRLITPPLPYPRRRAHRDPRGDLRPDPRRPSPRRGVRDASSGSRQGPVHTGRRAVAEGRA